MKEAARSVVAWEAEVDIVHNTVVSLSLAPRVKEFAVATAKVGDRVYAHRRDKPSLGAVVGIGGVMLEGTGLVTAVGKVEVYYVIPAVGVGQTLTIPLKLIAYRPVAA